MVIATRRASGGSMGAMSGYRAWLSASGTRLSRKILRVDASDPMSGFFLIRRAYLQQVGYRLTGTGFKILVDLLVSGSRPVRFGEVPYSFRSRQYGESKLDLNVELEYIYLLIDKLFGNYIPTRFALFVSIGTFGLILHLSILGVLYSLLKIGFIVSQVLATFTAMTFNFTMNNMITFRDLRLRGRKFLRGLFTFYLACTLGVGINISFGAFLLHNKIPWYVAGLAGMAISSVWNYGVNSVLTWKRFGSMEEYRHGSHTV